MVGSEICRGCSIPDHCCYRRPLGQRRIEYLRDDIRALLEIQDRRLITSADAVADLSLAPICNCRAIYAIPKLTSTATLPRPRSYERDRPPSSPTNSRDGNFQELMAPPAPEVPISPTTTLSTISRSSSGGTDTTHWAREVFRDITVLPSTTFPLNPDQDK